MTTLQTIALLSLLADPGAEALTLVPPPAIPATPLVEVTAVVSPPSLVAPWSREQWFNVSGSGVYLGEGRVLTNAHLVADPSMVRVRWPGQPEPTKAKLEHICNPCDLALLRVTDDSFGMGRPVAVLGDVPSRDQRVVLHGLESEGGAGQSFEAGVVSVGLGTYAHSLDSLLLMQIDAGVPPTSSGGPVLAGGRLVGVATQPLRPGDPSGYVIPVPVIRHFLEDVEDGAFDGFPDLGIEVQKVENDAMRSSLGLPAGGGGAFVRRIDYGSPAWGVLDVGDVVLGVDGRALSNELSVKVDENEVDALHLVRSRQIGDIATVQVLRSGQVLDLEVPLRPWKFLVPYHRDGSWPSYFIYGGLVFQPLTFEYLQVFREIPPHLAHYVFAGNLVTEERSQVIVITAIFPHPVNDGYSLAEDMVVATVNGQAPRTIGDLIRIVEDSSGPWVEIVTEQGLRVVLDVEGAELAQDEVLASRRIPSDRSRNLWVSAAAR